MSQNINDPMMQPIVQIPTRLTSFLGQDINNRDLFTTSLKVKENGNLTQELVTTVTNPEKLSLGLINHIVMPEIEGITKFMSIFGADTSYSGILYFLGALLSLQMFYLIPSIYLFYFILLFFSTMLLDHIVSNTLNSAVAFYIWAMAASLLAIAVSKEVFLYSFTVFLLSLFCKLFVESIIEGKYIDVAFLVSLITSFCLLFFHTSWTKFLNNRALKAVSLQGLFIVVLFLGIPSALYPIISTFGLFKLHISDLKDHIEQLKNASALSETAKSLKIVTSVPVDPVTGSLIGNIIYLTIKDFSLFFKIGIAITGFIMGSILYLITEEYKFTRKNILESIKSISK